MIYFLPLLISGLFIGLISLVVGDGFLMVLDSSIYTNITRAERDVLQVWSENSYGFSNYIAVAMNFYSTNLSFFGLNIFSKIKHFELAYYFLMLNVVWYSAWYAINRICVLLDFHKATYASLVTSGFYACNLYMICSWHGGTIESLWVVYALSPLIFLGVIRILSGRYSSFDMAWLGVFCGLTFYSGPYALATFITLGLALLFFWTRSLYELFKVVGIALFFGLFIGCPFIFLSIQTFLNGDRTPYIDIYALRTFSQYGLKGLFQFWYEWTMLEFWRGRYFHSYIEYYKSPLVISTALFLWTAFLLMMRNVYRDHRSKIPYAGFLLCIIGIGVFFAKANQAPFGLINLVLYKYWGLMGVFRTPDTKFGLPIITALSIGLAICILSEKRRVLQYAVALCILVQIAIFFTPLPLVEKKADKTFSRIVDVPPEYLEFSSLINTVSDSGGLLILPPMQQAVFDFKNGSGIAGKDVLGEMVNRPIFYVGGFTYGKTYQKYEELLANSKNANFLELGFRFIFLRNDLSDGLPKEYEAYSADLRLNPNLRIVANNSLGVLYEVKGSLPDLISGPNQEKIAYTKLSSTLYKLNESSGEVSSLIMRNSYHHDWSLCNIDQNRWLYIQLLKCSVKKSEPYMNLSNSFSGPIQLKNAYIFYPDQIKFYFLLGLSLLGISILTLFSIVRAYVKK